MGRVHEAASDQAGPRPNLPSLPLLLPSLPLLLPARFLPRPPVSILSPFAPIRPVT